MLENKKLLQDGNDGSRHRLRIDAHHAPDPGLVIGYATPRRFPCQAEKTHISAVFLKAEVRRSALILIYPEG
jgi:hypothetical protein